MSCVFPTLYDLRVNACPRRVDEWVPMANDHVRIMCPALSCRKILAVPVSSRGKHVRCKNCGATIKIPERAAPVGAPTDGEKQGEKQARPAKAA